MKVAVIAEWGKPLQIQEMPILRPGPNDILVKMIASGKCHSDLHEARGGIEKTSFYVSFDVSPI